MIIAVTMTFLVFEIFVRIVGINDQFTRKIFSKNLLRTTNNPMLIYELKPGGSSSIDNVTNRISSQGLRDREFTLPKPPGVRRIVAIGDSVTYGLGVRIEDTFSKQLESLFNSRPEAGKNPVEVLNMGVNGYKTAQEVEHLRVNGLRFEPDLVLLTYNLNDPGDFSRELPYFNSWQNRKWADESMSVPSRLWAMMTKYSELAFMIEYRTLRLRLGKVVEKKGNGNPDDAGTETAGLQARRRQYDGYFHLYNNAEAMNALAEALDRLRDLASENGFRVLFVVFPLLMDFEDYRWSELHNRILDMARTRGFVTADLLPVLKSGVKSAEMLQRRRDDFEHPNPAGHKMTADALFEIIETNGLLGTPAAENLIQ